MTASGETFGQRPRLSGFRQLVTKSVEGRHNLGVAKPWKCLLRLHDWDDRETPKPISTIKCVCAVMPTEKECALQQAERVCRASAVDDVG